MMVVGGAEDEKQGGPQHRQEVNQQQQQRRRRRPAHESVGRREGSGMSSKKPEAGAAATISQQEDRQPQSREQQQQQGEQQQQQQEQQQQDASNKGHHVSASDVLVTISEEGGGGDSEKQRDNSSSADHRQPQQEQRLRASSARTRRRRSRHSTLRKPTFMTYAIAGEEHAAKGDYNRAIPLFLRAVKMGTDMEEAFSAVMSQLGLCYYAKKEYRQALRCHKQELFSHRNTKNKRAEAKTYTNLGNAYKGMRDLEKASECYQRSLKLAKACSDAAAQARALDSIGNVYHMLGNACALEESRGRLTEPKDHDAFNAAIKYYRKTFGRKNKDKDPSGVGRACGHLASTYERVKDLDAAFRFHEKKLNIAIKHYDLHNQSRAYNALGNVRRQQGKFQEAIRYYELDLEVTQQLGDRQSEAVTHSNLGSAFQAFGDYQHAIEHHAKHLEIMEALDNKSGLAWAHDNIGAMYEHRRDYAKAASHYEQHIKLSQALDDRVSEAQGRENLARVQHYMEQGIQVIDMEGDEHRSLALRAPRALRKATVRGISTLSRKLVPGSVRGSQRKGGRQRRPSLDGIGWDQGNDVSLADMADEERVVLRDNSAKQRARRALSMSFARPSQHTKSSSDSEHTTSEDEGQEVVKLRPNRSKLRNARQRLSSLFSSRRHTMSFDKERRGVRAPSTDDDAVRSALQFDPSKAQAASASSSSAAAAGASVSLNSSTASAATATTVLSTSTAAFAAATGQSESAEISARSKRNAIAIHVHNHNDDDEDDDDDVDDDDGGGGYGRGGTGASGVAVNPFCDKNASDNGSSRRSPMPVSFTPQSLHRVSQSAAEGQSSPKTGAGPASSNTGPSPRRVTVKPSPTDERKGQTASDGGYLEIAGAAVDHADNSTANATADTSGGSSTLMPDLSTAEGQLLAAILNFDEVVGVNDASTEDDEQGHAPAQADTAPATATRSAGDNGGDNGAHGNAQEQGVQAPDGKHAPTQDNPLNQSSGPPSYLSAVSTLTQTKISPLAKRAWGASDVSQTFMAVKAYEANEAAELSFEVGDVFMAVENTTTPSMLMGTHEITGRRGLIPKTRVTKQFTPRVEEATDL